MDIVEENIIDNSLIAEKRDCIQQMQPWIRTSTNPLKIPTGKRREPLKQLQVKRKKEEDYTFYLFSEKLS